MYLIHPSFIGVFDLLVCGNSDPGTSGVLSPFCKMKGLHFNNDPEPDGFIFEFMDDIRNMMKTHGKEYVEVEFNSPEEYYEVMNNINEFTKNNINCYGVSRNAPVVVFTQEEELKAEHEIEPDAEEDAE